MSKFKQKSPVVEAIVWEGDNEKAIRAQWPKELPPPMFTKEGGVDLWTPSGILRAKVGDFVIIYPDGDVAVGRPEAFADKFEVIPETDKKGQEDFKDAEVRRQVIIQKMKEGVGNA